jgi:malonyl-CoA O-methyltransferase
VFAEAARVLCSGGLLAVSTLGENTFSELRAAFKAVDSYRHTLDFATETQISTALQSAALTDVRISRKSITLYYPDLKTLLHAIKAIGANTVGAGGRRTLLGRKGWHALEAAYETLRTPQGLPLSYDVILAYARSAKNTYSHATTA